MRPRTVSRTKSGQVHAVIFKAFFKHLVKARLIIFFLGHGHLLVGRFPFISKPNEDPELRLR